MKVYMQGCNCEDMLSNVPVKTEHKQLRLSVCRTFTVGVSRTNQHVCWYFCQTY